MHEQEYTQSCQPKHLAMAGGGGGGEGDGGLTRAVSSWVVSSAALTRAFLLSLLSATSSSFICRKSTAGLSVLMPCCIPQMTQQKTHELPVSQHADCKAEICKERKCLYRWYGEVEHCAFPCRDCKSRTWDCNAQVSTD